MGRQVLPALLSFGGSILPTILLGVFLESTLSTPCPDDMVGGAASPLTCIFGYVFIGFFSVVVALSLAFSLLLLLDNRRQRTWGIVTVAWYSLITGLTIVSALALFQVGVPNSPLALGLVLTPLLGVAGGVWSIASKPVGGEKRRIVECGS